MNTLPDTILASIDYPIVAIGGDNRFIYVNHAAEEFLRLTATNLGSSAEAVFDQSVLSILARVRRGACSVGDEEIDLPKLGRKNVSIRASVLHDVPDGVVVALQAREIAERLREHDQFRGTTRSMALLSALLAHEVKNPLAGIRGAAELIAADPGGDTSPLTTLIVEESDRIASLLTKVETLIGDKPPECQPVNIHEVLDHCIRLAQSSFARTIVLEAEFDPSLPPAFGDRDVLVQCFINLIKNACEATEKDNTIKIKSSYNLGQHLTLGSAGVSCPLVIEVIDYGDGIPEQIRNHIFEPFVTAKPNGKGLGLALVAQAISSHGGTISVSSRPGLTSFQIGLPVAGAEKGAGAA